MFKNKKKSQSTIDQQNRRQGSREQSPQSRQARGDIYTSDRYTRSKTLSSYAPGINNNRGGDKEIEKSERQRIHRVKARQKQVVTILTILAFLILLIGTIIFNFTSKITVSAVSDDANIVNALSADTYIKQIDSYLGAHPASRLRFSLDLKDMTSSVAEKSPEIKYIKRASFNGLGASNFDVVFRQPIIKWQAGDQTYYVDADGASFQQNMFDEPAIELRDSALVGGLVTDGKVKISRRIMEFSGRLVSGLQQNDYQVEYLSLPEDTTRQIAVKLTGGSTEYIFSIDQSVLQQIDALDQVSNYLSETGGVAQRVDLRVSNKAYLR